MLPSNFVILPNLKIAWLAKNLPIKCEKTKEIILLIRILQQIGHLYGFSKKSTNFRTYLRNLSILVAFYGKFAPIWW